MDETNKSIVVEVVQEHFDKFDNCLCGYCVCDRENLEVKILAIAERLLAKGFGHPKMPW